MKWYKKLVWATGGALGLAFVVTTGADLMVSQYNPTAIVQQQTQTTPQDTFTWVNVDSQNVAQQVPQVKFVSVAEAAQEQAQLSHFCAVQGPATTLNAVVTVQSNQNLLGTTGVLTGTGPEGQFVVNLTFSSQGGGRYEGTFTFASSGPYTITAGLVNLEGVPIVVHNLPQSFTVPRGFGSCATNIFLKGNLEAKTGSALSEDHTVMYSIDTSNPLYVAALALILSAGVVLYGAWMVGSRRR